jgi:rhodanese-related sulfurtransferase
VIEGGTEAWASLGLPVEGTGRKTISIERQVRIGAGALVLTGVILGFLVNPGYFSLSAFVGAGLLFAGITDWCSMGLLLARAPWNR